MTTYAGNSRAKNFCGCPTTCNNISNSMKIKSVKYAIYIKLIGEYPGNHPECVCLDNKNKIYALAPCLKKKAGQIIDDYGLAHIAKKLDRKIEEIKEWKAPYLSLSKEGEFVMKLTYNNGPVHIPYLDKVETDESAAMAQRDFRLRKEFNQLPLFFGNIICVKNLQGVARYETLDTRSYNLIEKRKEDWQEPKLLLKHISSMTKSEVDLYKISHLWDEYSNRLKRDWQHYGLNPPVTTKL